MEILLIPLGLLLLLLRYIVRTSIQNGPRIYKVTFNPVPRAMRDEELLSIVNNIDIDYDYRRECEKELERRNLLTIVY